MGVEGRGKLPLIDESRANRVLSVSSNDPSLVNIRRHKRESTETIGRKRHERRSKKGPGQRDNTLGLDIWRRERIEKTTSVGEGDALERLDKH